MTNKSTPTHVIAADQSSLDSLKKLIKEIINEPVTLCYKKLYEDAKDPVKKYDSDSCWDVFAASFSHEENYLEYGTGLAFDIPPGYEIKVYPRSSVSVTSLVLANSVGVVDETYKKELMIRFKTVAPYTGRRYIVGDRIAQIQLVKRVNTDLKEVPEIDPSGRGGFGSTGR